MAKQESAPDAVALRAAHVLDRCVIGPVDVPEHMRQFMEDLVAALLRVGLPVRDPSGVDGEAATGVMLALGPGPAGAAVRVIWRQHHSTGGVGEVWRTQQDAMHTALRTILTAQGYWMSDDTGDAPTVFGPNRP
ncbi:hypothetical protein [Streptomyces hokutonensis]|uniref:hypothetical protein n=1 Tax=Streptomyces hokutonensis TaxID=1306990 RepID=UPI00037D64E8|nr:hypothetical protein [Streptomyces hokutonensis]